MRLQKNDINNQFYDRNEKSHEKNSVYTNADLLFPDSSMYSE
jgi:hypothetical protein